MENSFLSSVTRYIVQKTVFITLNISMYRTEQTTQICQNISSEFQPNFVLIEFNFSWDILTELDRFICVCVCTYINEWVVSLRSGKYVVWRPRVLPRVKYIVSVTDTRMRASHCPRNPLYFKGILAFIGDSRKCILFLGFRDSRNLEPIKSRCSYHIYLWADLWTHFLLKPFLFLF